MRLGLRLLVAALVLLQWARPDTPPRRVVLGPLGRWLERTRGFGLPEPFEAPAALRQRGWLELPPL